MAQGRERKDEGGKEDEYADGSVHHRHVLRLLDHQAADEGAQRNG
jgi:hypothetical protein